MTLSTTRTRPAVRARRCPLCGTPPLRPCLGKPESDHLARYLDRFTAGQLSKAYMAQVLGELVVIDVKSTLITARAEPPRCPERNPDTGLQCGRVFPPHEGYVHVDESGASWDGAR